MRDTWQVGSWKAEFNGRGLLALAILLVCPTAKADDEPAAVQQRLMLSVNYLSGGGARVAAISPGSPALKLKRAEDPDGQPFQILVGDVITHVNRVRVTSPESYADGVNSQPGRATLRIIDGPTGQVADWLCDTVGVQQKLGIDLRYIGDGVKVTEIDPASPALRLQRAENPGAPFQLRVGEVITTINGLEVSSPATYVKALNRRAGSAILRIVDSVTGEVSDWLCGTLAEVVDNNVPPKLPDIDPNPNPNPDPNPNPNPSLERRRVAWVLLIGLTDDKRIGESIKTSLRYLEETFELNVSKDRLKFLKPIMGPDCNRENILRRVRAINPTNDDTIFVYYLGHGGYNPTINVPFDDPLAAHFFADMPGGDMMRRELTDAIQMKPGRLKILVTDTGNSPGQPYFDKKPGKFTALHFSTGLTPLEQLLFMNRGWVDVSASSRDQYSWFNTTIGGWFTWNFFQTITRENDWSNFFDHLSERSNKFFLNMRQSMIKPPTRGSDEALQAIRSQTAMVPTVIQRLERDVADVDAKDRVQREFDDMSMSLD